MFRNEYIGDAPYISCIPSLCHHKLTSRDQFLVLSSDGLYQYLSNEEVVLHVENFMERFPEGDPAQSLIEELLSRAAKKAGKLCLSCLFFHTMFLIFQFLICFYVTISCCNQRYTCTEMTWSRANSCTQMTWPCP
ncbi:unnamed protein product [Triticum turgidum subsp. durum]|uniref:protein-serine/threonine phosphatase n=1 Tax=Triticum turgidum subsp. durum TaxID=4567 RepID=A0A9R1BCH9_TRITD|nr:unnamed protein product [Triticum turgidum subsp. durum]